MIAARDLRKYVVRPTLKRMNLWSQAAEELLLGTIAQESRMGFYLHQISGPALGIYQIEPATHQDLWKNYLSYRADKQLMVASFASRVHSNLHDMNIDDDELIGNLAYSTAVCRMLYYRKPEALPDSKDIPGLALYWKTHYNTFKGKGTTEEFELNYRKWVN